MNWQRYLIIGIINFLLISCEKREYVTKAEFYYINNTDDSVTIKSYTVNNNQLNSYSIFPFDTLILFKEGEHPSGDPGPTQYAPGIQGDTVTVIFNDLNCLVQIGDRTLGYISYISSYTNEKVEKAFYKFYYTIDSTLVNQAVRCE